MHDATTIPEMEKRSLQIARSMSTSFAWPTLLVLACLYLAYAFALIGAIRGYIPLWLAFLINTFVAFGSYTPLHEAVHGNVGKRKMAGANRIVGVLASWLFLHNYSLQRQTHLSHHANLNDPARDADHWVAGKSWLSVTMRCLTIVLSHYLIGYRISDRRIVLTAVVENLVPVIGMAILGSLFGWQIAIFGMLLPAIVGSGLLGLFFDYLVHTPYVHGVSDRYLNTRVYLAPGPLNGLMTFLWFGQNYHLIHHLFPGVPFYRYARTFREVEPLLTQSHSPIVRLSLKLA